jgi:voltage-gated potassium channel Kch
LCTRGMTACTMSDRSVVLAVGGRQIELFITTLRLARSVASAWRSDPQFRSLVFLVVITLLGGTILYSSVEGWSVVDAFYFSVTTLTTVGLGDLAPTTTMGKLFTVIYIFAGLSIILGFIDTVAKETLRRRTRRSGGGEVQEDAPAS